MSFSVGAVVERGEDVAAALIDAFEAREAENQKNNGTYDEARSSVEVGAGFAVALMEKWGEAWAKASVSLSGHENPASGHRNGWANPCLSVSVAITEFAS